MNTARKVKGLLTKIHIFFLDVLHVLKYVFDVSYFSVDEKKKVDQDHLRCPAFMKQTL